eukprot:453630-Karenia_brevis.AAC.1
MARLVSRSRSRKRVVLQPRDRSRPCLLLSRCAVELSSGSASARPSQRQSTGPAQASVQPSLPLQRSHLSKFNAELQRIQSTSRASRHGTGQHAPSIQRAAALTPSGTPQSRILCRMYVGPSLPPWRRGRQPPVVGHSAARPSGRASRPPVVGPSAARPSGHGEGRPAGAGHRQEQF